MRRRVSADGAAARRRHRYRALCRARRAARSIRRASRCCTSMACIETDGRRAAARDAARLSRARCGGRRSGGVNAELLNFDAQLIIAGAAEAARRRRESICGPDGVTRNTARPRSLVPSGRKRNRPSMPVKPDGLVSTCGRKPLRALGLHQRGDQRHRVIGQRRGAHRILLEAGAIARGEVAIAGAVRRRIPAAVERRRGEDARIVPQPGAEKLHPLGVDAVRRPAPAPRPAPRRRRRE